MGTILQDVSGIVHVKLSIEEHKHLLNLIEKIRGKTVEVACSCGMGRWTAESADQLLKIKKVVVEMD